MHSPLRRLTAFVEAYAGLPDIMKLDPSKEADLTLGDLRALLAELEWQPIETAPPTSWRDPVYLFRPTSYEKNKWDIGYWHTGRRVVGGGVWRSHSSNPDYWCRQNPPTHWRPLPQPPSREGEE